VQSLGKELLKMRRYDTGDTFRLTNDAIKNYGTQYADKRFTVKQWYNHVGTDEHGLRLNLLKNFGKSRIRPVYNHTHIATTSDRKHLYTSLEWREKAVTLILI
jgi:hypothetical protein